MLTQKRYAGRQLRLIAATFCALLVAAAGAPAHAAVLSAPSGAGSVPPDEFLDVDAKPVLNWSVPDRYAASWNAYSPATGYDVDFVNPRSWTMNLDACSSTSVRRITGYTYTVSQVGTPWAQTHTTTACSLRLHTLPAQGIYRIGLVLHTDMGTAPGVSVQASHVAAIRDYLIVSMGDSLASGEGNPDMPGLYSYTIDPSSPMDPLSVTTIKQVQWKDQRCHRSAKSGPAVAARRYEDSSPHSSVTFLSVACSGAEIRHLVSDRYAGMEPDGTSVAPQVAAVSALVGPSSPRGGRAIDSLLISAGINNLDFSGIIERCLLNNNFADGHEACVTEDGIADKIADMQRQYAYLALAVRIKLPNARQVYLSDYPSDVFVGGACGLLAGILPGLGIDSIEGREMAVQGAALAAKIRQVTDTFHADYHWNYAGPLSIPFSGHAYCASPAWFNSIEKSLRTQGNRDGTAHPNAAGHLAYANLISHAMVS